MKRGHFHYKSSHIKNMLWTTLIHVYSKGKDNSPSVYKMHVLSGKLHQNN